jgi:hypothetical protein
MKRIRMIGLALVAVFAMSVAASTASASPVFYTKAAIGATGAPVPFTGTLGLGFLEGQKSKTKIECTGGTATGEANTATTTIKNVTKFTGCKTGTFNCENAGAGEIVTKSLKGELGDITANVLPGIRLSDETEGRGGKLVDFTCAGGAVAVDVKGSIIGSLSGAAGTEPANGKFAASNKLTFAQTAGVQKYTKFVGEVTGEQLESNTNGGAYEKSGQAVIATLKSIPPSNLGFTK